MILMTLIMIKNFPMMTHLKIVAGIHFGGSRHDDYVDNDDENHDDKTLKSFK